MQLNHFLDSSLCLTEGDEECQIRAESDLLRRIRFSSKYTRTWKGWLLVGRSVTAKIRAFIHPKNNEKISGPGYSLRHMLGSCRQKNHLIGGCAKSGLGNFSP